MGAVPDLTWKVRKRVPQSSIPMFDDIHARAARAFAGNDPTRMEYMLAFALSFWVLTEYDRRRLHLSRWARGYLYHFSKGSGRRLSPEELGEVEAFLATVIQADGAPGMHGR